MFTVFPHGASSKITDGVLDPSEDKKFAYLWEEREKFEGIERIIIATDNDRQAMFWHKNYLED